MKLLDFTNYMSYGFTDDVLKILICDNSKFQEIRESYYGFYEGTIRASIWAALRNKLPKTWFVQAECGYPEKKFANHADIVVWSPEQVPYVIEVKPFVGLKEIKRDLRKLEKYVKRNKSRNAYMIFAITYGSWRLKKLYPNKDWKNCSYCIDKYNIEKAMPYGFGNCPECTFTKDTLKHLETNKIKIIPLFVPVL